MTKKEQFITEINNLIKEALDCSEMIFSGLTHDANDYFETLKSNKEQIELTKNGSKILKYMQEYKDKYKNIFKSSDIAEGLFTSSRSVSGSMRKLVSEGLVEKIGGEPVTYKITESGMSINIDTINIKD